MTCRPIELPGGITGWVCTRGQSSRPAPCSVPHCGRYHTRLCDFPLAGRKAGKTCDAKLCDVHAVSVGPERDYCPAHARQGELIGT